MEADGDEDIERSGYGHQRLRWLSAQSRRGDQRLPRSDGWRAAAREISISICDRWRTVHDKSANTYVVEIVM